MLNKKKNKMSIPKTLLVYAIDCVTIIVTLATKDHLNRISKQLVGSAPAKAYFSLVSLKC